MKESDFRLLMKVAYNAGSAETSAKKVIEQYKDRDDAYSKALVEDAENLLRRTRELMERYAFGEFESKPLPRWLKKSLKDSSEPCDQPLFFS